MEAHDAGQSTVAGRRAPVSEGELVAQLAGLGVRRGEVLLVHTSFRAVRPVEGGPHALIRALIRSVGPEGTVVMPSWPDDGEAPFDAAVTDAASDLGVVARMFWRHPEAQRTTHVQAFAAVGPHAPLVLCDRLPLPPHIPASPVGRVHDLDGQILLLGVGHDANTTVHLAEVVAGVPYGLPKRCTAVVDGRTMLVDYRENDHCCARFALVEDWLRTEGRQREGQVGHAAARLVRSRDVVAAVVPRLREEPLLFLHGPSAGCADCDEARASVTAEG